MNPGAFRLCILRFERIVVISKLPPRPSVCHRLKWSDRVPPAVV
jgi:hypothetical protein